MASIYASKTNISVVESAGKGTVVRAKGDGDTEVHLVPRVSRAVGFDALYCHFLVVVRGTP